MEDLLPKHESLTVEFKSDRTKVSNEVIIDAVVAFANTGGGDLYIGIEDNGEVTGCHEEHMDYTRLAAFIANNTMPPVPVIVERLDAPLPILRIHVTKYSNIVATMSGKVLRRQIKQDGTPENVPMYPHEINTRLSSLSLLDYSAQPIPGAKYEDLDPVEREHLRNILRDNNGERALLDLDDEGLDKALQFVKSVQDELVPTYTGMLLIGRKEKLQEFIPTAEIGYMALNGTNVTVNESFYATVLSGAERIFSFIDARNSECEMTAGLFRISIPEFDKRAVREAVVNAIAHRDYTRLGRVRVQLDNDGLTVVNPGGFIEGVTIDNILNAEPHGRNPALADALKRIGLAERSGRGVDRIFEGSLIYGRPLPDYSESSATQVRLFIPRGLPDERFIHMISEEQRRSGQLLPVNTLLILNTLKQSRRMTIADIAEATKLSEARVRNEVERLSEVGLLEPIGSGRARAYILSAKAYKNKAEYVRQTDIEKIRYHELVLRLLETQETITRKDVIDLLHISPSQAYRVLKKMVNNGELKAKGTTRNVRYTKP